MNSFLLWIALAGGLLLGVAFLSTYLGKLPITTSCIYLAIGLGLGPVGLGLLELDLVKQRGVLEKLTEVAVIVSLFVGGLKLRLPLTHPAWVAAFRLAGPLMVICIAGVAATAHLIFGFGWPSAFLLGAILAPTDPVLAGMVSVNHAADHDRMRYGLSGEAGFNDGAAFPFVILALMWMANAEVGSWIGGWALHRLLWAIPAGLIFGYWMGKGVGHLAIYFRRRNPANGAPGDFLALASIALAYSGAEAVGAWGFLAVFAAGLGVRQAEKRTTADHPVAGHRPAGEATTHPPAEHITEVVHDADSTHPTLAAGRMVAEILTFGDTAERLLELMMVLLIGVCLTTLWDPRAIGIAVALMVFIRPLAAQVVLLGTPTRPSQRWLMGWFGIRGIGSLYYLAYSLNHGPIHDASAIVGITVSVIAISIVLHGVSSPLLEAYEKHTIRRRASKDAVPQG